MYVCFIYIYIDVCVCIRITYMYTFIHIQLHVYIYIYKTYLFIYSMCSFTECTVLLALLCGCLLKEIQTFWLSSMWGVCSDMHTLSAAAFFCLRFPFKCFILCSFHSTSLHFTPFPSISLHFTSFHSSCFYNILQRSALGSPPRAARCSRSLASQKHGTGSTVENMNEHHGKFNMYIHMNL